MLSQSLVLAFLSSLALALPIFAVSGDWLLSVRLAAFPAALALAFGALGQVSITRHTVQGRIDRARFVPWRPAPIIDQPPLPAPEPLVKPEIQREIRLIPVNHYQPPPRSTVMASDGRPLFPSNRLIDGVPEADLKFFCELIPSKGGHQRSKWLGTVFPSGRKCDPEYYALLVAPLVKTKCIEGRGPRVAGTVTCSPQRMKERLGLAP